MVIRKEDILRGKENPVLVKIESMNDEIPLRPLSKIEWADIEAIGAEEMGVLETETRPENPRKGFRGKPVNVTMQKMDMSKQLRGDFKTKVEALYLSMNNNHSESQKWTKEEIENITGVVFDEIYEAVENLSGVNNPELKKDVDKFPGNG